MKVLISLYENAFAEYQISFNQRPDGKFVLNLSKSGMDSILKVLAPQALYIADAASAEIQSLQRELSIRNNALATHGAGDCWTNQALPTYSGQALSLRAMQSLFARRKLQARQSA